jgi:transposase
MGIVVGCDVSKDWIDVQIDEPGSNRQLRIANNERAIARFARGLLGESMVGMEATGTLHELLAVKLYESGHAVFVVNPRWIHLYARGVGLRGKTDRGDAGLIARFIAAEGRNLHPYQPPSAEQRKLRALLLQRVELVKLKSATRQSLGEQARELIGQFEKVLDGIDHRIAQLIERVPDWHLLAKRLRTEPGIGPIVAAHLVQVLTRFPFATSDAFIAHTGMDPRPNDSGQKRGKRRLTHHGDAVLRKMLFMAAMSACKLPQWRALYEANRKKGLPSTAAYIVVARKLARIAFGLFRSGEAYDPSRFGPIAA